MELLSFYSFLLKQCQILVLCNITHAGIWALTKKGSVQPSHGWARTTRRVLVVLDPHICTNITKGPGHWQRRGCPGHSRPPPPPLLWTTCCLRDNAWPFKQSASPSEGSGSWVRAALVFLWSYVLSRIMVAASHTCFSRSLGQQASNMEDKTIKLQNYRNYFYYIFIPLFNKSQ